MLRLLEKLIVAQIVRITEFITSLQEVVPCIRFNIIPLLFSYAFKLDSYFHVFYIPHPDSFWYTNNL